MTDWPQYEMAWKDYSGKWAAFNATLYEMCEKNLRHDDLGNAIRKVGIISRAYATGLERHTSENNKESNIIGVARTFTRLARSIDSDFRELNKMSTMNNGLSPELLERTMRMHGMLVSSIANLARDANSLRSFVSKYMHFHCPLVPLYDSRANSVLTNWYPLRTKRNYRIAFNRDFDELYYRFCNRFLLYWDDALNAGLTVSVRRLDHYLLWCYSPLHQ
jgi:hypothetical protein